MVSSANKLCLNNFRDIKEVLIIQNTFNIFLAISNILLNFIFLRLLIFILEFL